MDNMDSTDYWLLNVQIERRYVYDGDAVRGTETELSHVQIREGVIVQVIAADRMNSVNMDGEQILAEPAYDGRGMLMLPSFTEKHVHLDKTLLGEPWQAVIPASGVAGRCEIEKRILPQLVTPPQQRAELLLQRLIEAGSTHIRTHIDVYPEAGTKQLEPVLNLFHSYRHQITHEVVAFPQHGLLRSGSKTLVREALRQGAHLVGGVDPATMDTDLEASLQLMVELAVEAGAGIDLHLHDPDYLGTYTMKRLARLTVDAGLQGNVSISHAFALGEVIEAEARSTADLLAEAGITIITSAPHGRTLPPVPLLWEHGVSVEAGCDNIYDTWQPFGNGDILERASRLAERFAWIDERSLAQSLRLITGGRETLDAQGERVWPVPGDSADLILVDASCAAEAVARRAPRKAVFSKGHLIWDDQKGHRKVHE